MWYGGKRERQTPRHSQEPYHQTVSENAISEPFVIQSAPARNPKGANVDTDDVRPTQQSVASWPRHGQQLNWVRWGSNPRPTD